MMFQIINVDCKCLSGYNYAELKHQIYYYISIKINLQHISDVKTIVTLNQIFVDGILLLVIFIFKYAILKISMIFLLLN